MGIIEDCNGSQVWNVIFLYDTLISVMPREIK
jgi:hypothetical protein